MRARSCILSTTTKVWPVELPHDSPERHIRYNKSLRHDVDQYIKNQLINLFRDCWLRVGDTCTSCAIASLMEEYYRAYEDGGSPRAEYVNDIYERLNAAMGIILFETATTIVP